jgi:hypothetical protein
LSIYSHNFQGYLLLFLHVGKFSYWIQLYMVFHARNLDLNIPISINIHKFNKFLLLCHHFGKVYLSSQLDKVEQFHSDYHYSKIYMNRNNLGIIQWLNPHLSKVLYWVQVYIMVHFHNYHHDNH